MSQGPRIYNLFPLLGGPLPEWRSHFKRAAAMGFTWIFVNPFHQAGFSGSLYSVKDHYALDRRLDDGTGRAADEQLREMLGQAAQLGLGVIMDLVVNHTAFDSPLVQEHPAWFRRDRNGQIVHPGALDGTKQVFWRDLVEVDNAGSADRESLWAYWRALVLRYASLGFRGFRCDAAYQVPDELWRDLIGAVKTRHPEVIWLAETLGCTPELMLATAKAGFDYIFNSSKWWDFRAPWCLEQYAVAAPVVSSISFPESHDTPRLATDLNGDRRAVLQRYALAATFSTGVMMPIGFEYGFRRRLHVVETTPRDWETPSWDLTEAITAINRTKAAHRPLNEEGPLLLVDLGNPSLVGFRKKTRGGREEVTVILNLERERAVRLRMPAQILIGPDHTWTDLLTGICRPGSAAGELELGPSGVALVHEAPSPVSSPLAARGDLGGRSG